MDPSAVANMQLCTDQEDLIDMYGPLKLETADLIFLPINDSLNPLNPSKFRNKLWCLVGGTHWGLLVYYKNSMYYLDSSGGVIYNVNNIAMSLKAIIQKETT